jgi:hypothetical protein
LTDRKPIFKFHREAFDQALLFVQKYFLGSCLEPAWELWMALTFSGLLILIVASFPFGIEELPSVIQQTHYVIKSDKL